MKQRPPQTWPQRCVSLVVILACLIMHADRVALADDPPSVNANNDEAALFKGLLQSLAIKRKTAEVETNSGLPGTTNPPKPPRKTFAKPTPIDNAANPALRVPPGARPGVCATCNRLSLNGKCSSGSCSGGGGGGGAGAGSTGTGGSGAVGTGQSGNTSQSGNPSQAGSTGQSGSKSQSGSAAQSGSTSQSGSQGKNQTQGGGSRGGILSPRAGTSGANANGSFSPPTAAANGRSSAAQNSSAMQNAFGTQGSGGTQSSSGAAGSSSTQGAGGAPNAPGTLGSGLTTKVQKPQGANPGAGAANQPASGSTGSQTAGAQTSGGGSAGSAGRSRSTQVLTWEVVQPAGMGPDTAESAISMEDSETDEDGRDRKSFQLDAGTAVSALVTGPKNPLIVPPEVASVVYVIDCSSSMEGSRFATVTTAVRDAILQLNESQQYAVLFFNTQAMQINGGGLRYATLSNKRTLAAELVQIAPAGGTDPTDALLIALQIQPETIVVFSDGEFDEHVVQRVTKLNRSSGLNCQINCVGLSSQISVLQKLAQLNGPGNYLQTN